MIKVANKELSKHFIDLGAIPSKFFAVVYKQRIRPDIVEKYGELSDDGYYELTKDWGGNLDFNEVYENVETVITAADHSYFHYDDKQFLLLYSEIFDFLDEKKILVEIKPKLKLNRDKSVIEVFSWEIKTKTNAILSSKQFSNREEATEDAFIRVLERFYNIKL